MSFRVYETSKMYVEIHPDRVIKQFKSAKGYKKRYSNEKEALIRLAVIEAIPNITHFDDGVLMLVTTRCEGTEPDILDNQALLKIHTTIEQCLQLGVARHSLPERDLLLCEDGKISIVDFERVTLRRWKYSPLWLLASWVVRFNLYRLLHRHNPDVLSAREQRILRRGAVLRIPYEIWKKRRSHYRSKRNKTAKSPT